MGASREEPYSPIVRCRSGALHCPPHGCEAINAQNSWFTRSIPGQLLRQSVIPDLMHQVSAPSAVAARTVRRRRDRFSATLPIMAITAAGAVFRLLHLGAKSLWLDEILSVSIARLDAPGFRNIVFSWEANMALYYALLRAWVHVGDSEVILRLPSALASIATVPLVYLIGRRLFSQSVGLIAALLLAVNLFAIRYAQEARSY